MNAGGDVFAFFETYLLQRRLEAAQELSQVADRQKKNIERRKTLRAIDATLENAVSKDTLSHKDFAAIDAQFQEAEIDRSALNDLGTNVRLAAQSLLQTVAGVNAAVVNEHLKDDPAGAIISEDPPPPHYAAGPANPERGASFEADEDASDEHKAVVARNRKDLERVKAAIKAEIDNATDDDAIVSYDMQRWFSHYNSAVEMLSRTEKKREESEKSVINNI